jgi:phage terminase small subunit
LYRYNGSNCLCKHSGAFMPALPNARHEAFAQALARSMSASAAYAKVGFKPHRANAATLARKKHISVRVAEIQAEQLAIHHQATAEAAASAKVTIESLIQEAERLPAPRQCPRRVVPLPL